jgi:hypothetical protein
MHSAETILVCALQFSKNLVASSISKLAVSFMYQAEKIFLVNIVANNGDVFHNRIYQLLAALYLN